MGESNSSIARIKQRISQLNLEIINAKNSFMKNVADELQNTHQAISESSERLSNIEDIRARTKIRSPIDGYVHQLKFNTIGGVIPPNANILSIVPDDQSLTIEAKINSNDINNLLSAQGNTSESISHLKAKVRILSLSSRNYPILNAELLSLSPDTIKDQYSGQSFFEIRAKLSSDAEELLPSLHPGMPIVMFIPTRSQTLLQYLFSPLFSFLQTSFREN